MVNILILIIFLIVFIYLIRKQRFININGTRRYTGNDKNTIALIFHVGNIHVFYEIMNDYPRFFSSNIDIYITVNNNENKDIVLNHFPNAYVKALPNKGMDIGPFLNTIQYIIEQNIEYDYYIKIHTKTDKNWRDEMLLPMSNNLDRITDTFSYKPYVYGSKKWFDTRNNLNDFHINKILQRNYLEYQDNFESCKHTGVIWGTCFIFNKAYFNELKKIKDFDYEQSILEEGYIVNSESRATHAWEYFVGIPLCFHNSEIITLE